MADLTQTFDFYTGTVLRIDLTHAKASVEPLNQEWARLYLGGKGLLLRYLWANVPPRVDPWSPDNPVILMSGPFAGTSVSTASRLVVGAKSPVTGILNDSYVGGSFAPEMKFAGYDPYSSLNRHPVVSSSKPEQEERRWRARRRSFPRGPGSPIT